jgi:hypothetical protein
MDDGWALYKKSPYAYIDIATSILDFERRQAYNMVVGL